MTPRSKKTKLKRLENQANRYKDNPVLYANTYHRYTTLLNTKTK